MGAQDRGAAVATWPVGTDAPCPASRHGSGDVATWGASGPPGSGEKVSGVRGTCLDACRSLARPLCYFWYYGPWTAKFVNNDANIAI